ncbi:hypothetical protein BDW60DRAFT_209173 [Aspergillus nidulans var. acristatus]
MRNRRILLTLVLVLAAAPNASRQPVSVREMDTGRNMEIGDRLKGKVIVLFASTVAQWYRRTTTSEDPDHSPKLLCCSPLDVQPDVKIFKVSKVSQVSQVARGNGNSNSLTIHGFLQGATGLRMVEKAVWSGRDVAELDW